MGHPVDNNQACFRKHTRSSESIEVNAREAVGLGRPNSPFMQLSPYLTEKCCQVGFRHNLEKTWVWEGCWQCWKWDSGGREGRGSERAGPMKAMAIHYSWAGDVTKREKKEGSPTMRTLHK